MSREQQRRRTREALLRESRRLFAARGYAGVGLSEITRAAEVTKGALYHHFDSKEALFRAVLGLVQQEVAGAVARAADAEPDPWDQLVAGCNAFLAAGTDPGIRRIMLVDAPAVIGWNEWRTTDEANSGRHLTEILTTLAGAGVIAEQPIAPLVHLLSGAMNEAALWLASTPGPAALADTQTALSRLLGSLRTS